MLPSMIKMFCIQVNIYLDVCAKILFLCSYVMKGIHDCTYPCRAVCVQQLLQCFVSQKSKWAVAIKSLIRLGCLEQRQAVYIVTSTSCLLPIFLLHGQPTCKALYLIPIKGILLIIIAQCTQAQLQCTRHAVLAESLCIQVALTSINNQHDT